MIIILLFLFKFSLIQTINCANPKYVDPFLFNGVTNLLYDRVDKSDIRVSKSCQESLNNVQDHLDIGSSWAYKIIDASSKPVAGLIGGTVTSLGDYDQCLDVNSENVKHPFKGKHCMIELKPPMYSNRTRLHPVLNFFNPTFAVCVPSTCSQNDLSLILTQKINGWTLSEEIFCDTSDSISLLSKIGNLNTAQWTSLVVITLIFFYEMIATFTHFMSPNLHNPLVHFCLIHNTTSLFSPKFQPERTIFVDGFKIFMVVLGIAAHTLVCLEKFVAIGLIRNLEGANDLFSSFLMQPLNEMGFDFFSVLSGFALVTTAFQSIKLGTLGYRRLILSRYFRFVPPTLILIAIQLLWPLISNGPLFTKFYKIVVDDCSQNWWRHVFFVANHDPERMCLAHTFFTSVDYQLFLLGLGILSLLAILPTITFLLGATLFITCYIILYQTTQGIGTPILFGSQINLINSINYMLKVHFPTFTHIPGFLTGLLTGYIIQTRKCLYEKSFRNSLIHFLILGPLLGLMFWSPALHTIFGLIPNNFYPHFIVASKLTFAILAPNVILFVAHIPIPTEKHVRVTKDDSNNNQVTHFSVAYRIFKILNEISFSMHLTNYLFVQYNFLTSRILFDNTLYALTQRVIYSLHMVIILAFVFHILFVIPIENIRKSYFHRKEKVT